MRVLIILCLVGFQLQAATLHVVLLIDTQAENIERAMQCNLIRWERRIKEIERYTDYKVQKNVLKGDSLRVENISEVLASIRIEEGDGILFYFCGHGCRTESKEDPWPYLALTPEEYLIDFNALVNFAIDKNPRFLYMQAECCNSYVSHEKEPQAKKLISEHIRRKNYRILFQEKPTWIISSSSQPGEYSYAYVGSKGGMLANSGSCFTLAVMNAFDKELRNKSGASWEALFQYACKIVREDQTPQVIITYP